MKPNCFLFACFAFLVSLQGAGALSPEVPKVKGPYATATLSHRVVKIGQSPELLITVRRAVPPVLAQPECPQGLELRTCKKAPQHLIMGDVEIWLLKYRIIPHAIGDYEIPPIRVSDGSGCTLTKPLILHVSEEGKPLPPNARELSLTTDIPLILAQEAVKTCTTPAPKAKPDPTPVDIRPFPSKVLSTFAHGITWFWNYPGK